MTVKFTLATKEHIKGIIDLCNECFNEKTDYQYAMEIYEKNKYDPNQIYLIGIVDEKIIAHTRIAIVPTIFDGMDTFAILNHVCVKEEFRKHKIATKMLEVVEKICKERNCRDIKLWSRNFRIPAHACYKKYGFVADDATFFAKKI